MQSFNQFIIESDQNLRVLPITDKNSFKSYKLHYDSDGKIVKVTSDSKEIKPTERQMKKWQNAVLKAIGKKASRYEN